MQWNDLSVLDNESLKLVSSEIICNDNLIQSLKSNNFNFKKNNLDLIFLITINYLYDKKKESDYYRIESNFIIAIFIIKFSQHISIQ